MRNFKINNIDITNQVAVNTFNYMKRLDDVFGTGSFMFESKEIDYNIPPYSVLTIDNSYFLCSSEATYHYGKKSFFHNVSIIEATSVLSRFLVGSKTFSVTGTNTYDHEKINVLIALMNQKYNVNITVKNHNNFLREIEYVFTAGTTLYDAINEIAKNYNYRVEVTKIEDKSIEIDFIDLNNLQVENISEDIILSKTIIQNSENYCKYLESEATNVIDTTNTTIVDNIYPSANDIKLNEDTYLLKLPTNVYNVKRFWVNVSILLDTFLTFPETITSSVVYKTYEEWAVDYPVLIEIYNNYYKKYFTNWDEFKTKRWKTSFAQLAPETEYRTDKPLFKIDLTDRIVSKEQYDLIEDQYKPDYVYYTIGSNIIDGFNVFYKNDFWNTIIGESNKPFFLNLNYEDRTAEGVDYNGVKISRFRATDVESIFLRTYGVEYYPIANPFLINTKNDIPDNELDYKNYALSYGKSSNYVDFDKLNNSMQIENQSIGKVEMIVECDISKKDFFYSYQKVNINGDDWYVSNAQYQLTTTQSIVTLNLVKTYNKVADVISLNSQYNTTKNPLQNIIERPLLCETNKIFEFTQGKTYIIVSYGFANGLFKNLAFAPVILQNNNETYFYVEMFDQYSAGTKSVTVSGVDDSRKVEDVSYVDSNNEAIKYTIKVVQLDFNLMEIDDLRKLPELPDDWVQKFEYLDIVNNVLLYKDAREKLTFTIKANNCIIK